jgi:hypothetical protein
MQQVREQVAGSGRDGRFIARLRPEPYVRLFHDGFQLLARRGANEPADRT